MDLGMGKRMDGSGYGQTHVWIWVWANAWMDLGMGKRMDGRIEGWMGERIDRHTDPCMDKWMDG
eukprot:99934-Chlamydomonas_euryale.AAC.1